MVEFKNGYSIETTDRRITLSATFFHTDYYRAEFSVEQELGIKVFSIIDLLVEKTKENKISFNTDKPYSIKLSPIRNCSTREFIIVIEQEFIKEVE